jgi:hypothetical protein
MITATLDKTGAVAAWLQSLGPKAAFAAEAASSGLLDRLLAIADGKLSGTVLNARSGRLRDSLRATVDVSSAIAASLTADTPYAAYQEYGFTGVERVRAHLRNQTQAFGRPIAPVAANVRAYERQVDYPAHSYLRAALAELAPQIASVVADATQKALAP